MGWAVVIGLIVYLGVKYQVDLEKEAATMPFVLFSIIFPIVIGTLLKLPNLMIEIKQNKQWMFDWIKFIAIALPYLYIISMSILPFSSLGEGIIKAPEIIMIGSPTIQTIAGIVLGYILLDSLKQP